MGHSSKGQMLRLVFQVVDTSACIIVVHRDTVAGAEGDARFYEEACSSLLSCDRAYAFPLYVPLVRLLYVLTEVSLALQAAGHTVARTANQVDAAMVPCKKGRGIRRRIPHSLDDVSLPSALE